MLANLEYQIKETDMWLIHILNNKKKSFLTPIIDKEIFKSSKENRPAKCDQLKTKNLLTMWLWQLCWCYNLKTSAGINYGKKEEIFIKFKRTILEKIIPLTTKDKKKQEKLVQQIQECFPDSILT